MNAKILFVRSANKHGGAPFTDQQAQALRELGLSVDTLEIHGKGVLGYLSNYGPLRSKVAAGAYSLVHAHFGLAGMLAVMQRICPAVITFLGCDVNVRRSRVISRLAARLAAHKIFVERSLVEKLGILGGYSLIPHGINLTELVPVNKTECRRELGIPLDSKIAVFASTADRIEKNYALAKAAVDRIPGVTLKQLGGYGRAELVKLLNAADVLLLTSVREGSPVVVKEAMACNCPIVSTDVGDVKRIIGETRGCYITSFDPDDVAVKLRLCFAVDQRTDGRAAVLKYDQANVARQIVRVYEAVLGRSLMPEAEELGDVKAPARRTALASGD